MDYTQKLIHLSNYWYNDGLKKANIRDLSGAVVSLKRSLQFHRENIAARNLLGLVYYGRGEVSEALVEWIISKNLKTAENIANYYIGRVQESPTELDNINQAVKKYNQCLVYCHQNGEDLALIQLKKIVVMHPGFLKAWQLLSLLYIQSKQFPKARTSLRKARQLDTTNEITLRYIFELSQRREKKLNRVKEQKEETVSYKLGNETIIQPASAMIKDTRSSVNIMNILVGIVVGAAVVWFLVAPQFMKIRLNRMNKEMINYSDQIAAQNAQIDALKTELSSYRTDSESSQATVATAADTAASYENLMTVNDQYNGGNTANATMIEEMLAINRASLGDAGQSIYDEIANDLFPDAADTAFSDAQTSYASGDYGATIDSLNKTLRMVADYNDGEAMLLLGNAYAHNGDSESAKSYWQQVVKNHPDTDVAAAAKSGIDGTVTDLNDSSDNGDGSEEYSEE